MVVVGVVGVILVVVVASERVDAVHCGQGSSAIFGVTVACYIAAAPGIQVDGYTTYNTYSSSSSFKIYPGIFACFCF